MKSALQCLGLLILACLLKGQTPPIHASSDSAAPAYPGAGSAQVRRPEGDPAKDLTPLLEQFVNVLSLVRSEASEPLTPERLIYEGAIPSMLRQLDPHTQFFDPGQFQQLKQMEDSEQKGFGSIVSVLPGQVIFLQTLPGTPSNKAGIQAGDELVAINNIAIQNLQPDQIVQLLTEARQQKITVWIRRQGSASLLQLSLTPELVDAPSVDRAFLLEPGVGYVRVSSWDLQTAKELSEAITKLGGKNLHGLVIDLRNNPGGVVKTALDAASLFLQPGQQILTAKGRASEPEKAEVPKNTDPYKFRLAVLINEKTASASEILSGALQDHDRAVIVGEPSYGKGLVQSVMPLSDGAGLAITTAFYYTPSGRSIQRPLRNSALSETFSNKPRAGAPTYRTDNGRTVTGGGGIEPDLLVPPPGLTRLEAVLESSGAVTSFATEYLATHPHLPDTLEITPEMLDALKVFLSSHNIQPNVPEWAAERSWISNRLKEDLVTQARGVDKGDEVAAQNDPQTQAALKALRDDRLLASGK